MTVERYHARMVRVVDALTYDLEIMRGQVNPCVRIRLNGWTAPALPSEMGKAAATLAHTLLSGKAIVLGIVDKAAPIVADVYVDGEHLGALLAARGLAESV